MTFGDGRVLPDPPTPEALGPTGLFSLCSGGDTVPGVKSWQ